MLLSPLSLSESLLRAPALSDIQFKSGEPHYLSFGITIGLAQAFYPRHSPVGPHDSERAVKDVLRLRVLDLIDEVEHLPSVLFVHAAQPGFKRGRLFRSETV